MSWKFFITFAVAFLIGNVIRETIKIPVSKNYDPEKMILRDRNGNAPKYECDKIGIGATVSLYSLGLGEENRLAIDMACMDGQMLLKIKSIGK